MPKKSIVFIIGIVCTFIVSAIVYFNLPNNDNIITATGMIEVTQVDITPKVSGYLVERHFEEGTRIVKGDIIAVIDKIDYQLQLQQADAAYKSAQAKLEDLQAGSRDAEISYQQATVDSSKQAMDKATADYYRFEQLYQKGAISEQELTNYRVAMTNSIGIYKQTQASYSLSVEGSRINTIKAQEHTVEQMDVTRQLAQTKLDDTDLKAPATGYVLSKNFEVGEFVNSGSSIATLGNLTDCWVKIYIPSTLLGKVYLNQVAQVKIDSYPNEVFSGYIKEIATQAEFTPRQTITKDERANLVFAVKVAINNPDGIFKPGMPAEIILQ